MFSAQSFSITVRRSITFPSTSPAHAIRASPSLRSAAMSMMRIGCAYSLKEPSLRVIFMSVLLFVDCDIFRRQELKNPCRHLRINRDEFLRGSTLFDFPKKALFIVTITESPDRIGVSREVVFGSFLPPALSARFRGAFLCRNSGAYSSPSTI